MHPSAIRDTVSFLNNALGPTLVAALSGARDRTISPSWESKDGPLPDTAASERLQCANEAWKLIEASEGPDVARLWFLGANPWLGDDSPVTAIREGRFRQTEIAAKALVEDSFSG